jgi:transitional endoplasmic reticulum ATPase
LTNETKSGSDGFVSLKVSETNPKFVGKGMALIDPAVVEEMKLTTGDVIEISTSSGKKKTFALLWSGQPEDYGSRIIRIDGYTRNNLDSGE